MKTLLCALNDIDTMLMRLNRTNKNIDAYIEYLAEQYDQERINETFYDADGKLMIEEVLEDYELMFDE